MKRKRPKLKPPGEPYIINFYVSESCSEQIFDLIRQAKTRGEKSTYSDIIRSVIASRALDDELEADDIFNNEPRHRFRVKLFFPQVLGLDIWIARYERRHRVSASRGEVLQALLHKLESR